MPFNEKIINERNGNIAALVEIMRALRDREKGCPWDIEQTFESISQYTIEEAYEVVDAIDRKDWDNLKTELGDLLLQSIYHSQIASEKEYFNFNDVVREVSDKMVSRHPHVFGEDKVNKTSQQQIEDWETIKAAERKSKYQGKVLDGVAVNLPALVRAIKLQKRAARVGFDWPSYENVLDKIIEEARELADAAADGNSAHTEEEFGDEQRWIVYEREEEMANEAGAWLWWVLGGGVLVAVLGLVAQWQAPREAGVAPPEPSPLRKTRHR